VNHDTFFPLSVPMIRGNESKYVQECLDTEWVSTAGSYVDRLEQEFASIVGAKYAVACSSGTAALQVALRCAGVGADDEVIVPTVTFIATANAVTYLGAEPVFVDCDSFYNLNIESLQNFLANNTYRKNGASYNSESKRRIAAIIPVHVFGNAVDMQRLKPICDEFSITIVEDAAESLGTRYRLGELAGRHSGTIGLLGCFSFNGNKIVTTGGGGMIVTDNKDLATRCRHLTTTAKSDEVRYVHDEIGYNFRLTNVQAAIGVAQLEGLPDFLEAKRRNRAAYERRLKAIPGLRLGAVPEYADNNLWMYPVRIDSQRFGMDREQLMATLGERRVQTRPLWQLNHRQTPYRKCMVTETPVADLLLAETLCLPCSSNLTETDVEEIVNRIPR
jgi:perosamine synthetase